MFNWTQQTILYLSYSASIALTNDRGINHATPAFNLLRPQLTADSGRHHTSNNRRTRITTVRPNKPHHKQEKTSKRSPNHRPTILSNSCHQNNQHNHQFLKHKTRTANQSTKNLNQATKDQIKDLIIETVKKNRNRKTTNQTNTTDPSLNATKTYIRKIKRYQILRLALQNTSRTLKDFCCIVY